MNIKETIAAINRMQALREEPAPYRAKPGIKPAPCNHVVARIADASFSASEIIY